MITRCKVETKLERPGLNNGFMHKGYNKVNKPLKEGEQLTKKLTRPKNSKKEKKKPNISKSKRGREILLHGHNAFRIFATTRDDMNNSVFISEKRTLRSGRVSIVSIAS